MKELTRRQQDVLDAIQKYQNANGFPPSIREITAELNLSSAAGVHKHIKALVKKGVLSKSNFLSRSLRLINQVSAAQEDKMYDIPLSGYVAAGSPIEAITQSGESIPVPETLLSSPSRPHFALKVRGNSMIEEGILDGDIVILESRDEANNGEAVVALINNQEATLKRIFTERGKVRLQPANVQMEPIILETGDVRVQGVVVAVMRRY